jgi:hypothetical protein
LCTINPYPWQPKLIRPEATSCSLSRRAMTLDRPDSPMSDVAVGKVRWYSTAFLVVIAACLAEFLTGSTPFLRPFGDPIGFSFNLGLYGGGALLIFPGGGASVHFAGTQSTSSLLQPVGIRVSQHPAEGFGSVDLRPVLFRVMPSHFRKMSVPITVQSRIS